ncbi:Protein of unknown function [Gryllus bimaculatus]|nr:Protein of unknown function [Gryllus bimaculatus]
MVARAATARRVPGALRTSATLRPPTLRVSTSDEPGARRPTGQCDRRRPPKCLPAGAAERFQLKEDLEICAQFVELSGKAPGLLWSRGVFHGRPFCASAMGETVAAESDAQQVADKELTRAACVAL